MRFVFSRLFFVLLTLGFLPLSLSWNFPVLRYAVFIYDFTLISLAFVYTLVRLVEAYGLWRLRAWAEWFAIISGMFYLPFEIYEIFQMPTAVRFVIFFFNLALVFYLIYVRGEAKYHKIHDSNQF